MPARLLLLCLLLRSSWLTAEGNRHVGAAEVLHGRGGRAAVAVSVGVAGGVPERQRARRRDELLLPHGRVLADHVAFCKAAATAQHLIAHQAVMSQVGHRAGIQPISGDPESTLLALLAARARARACSSKTARKGPACLRSAGRRHDARDHLAPVPVLVSGLT